MRSGQLNRGKIRVPQTLWIQPREWRRKMDKNRTQGLKKEVRGGAKEVAGKVTGNKSKEIAGNVEKNIGKAQNAIGKAADKARGKK